MWSNECWVKFFVLLLKTSLTFPTLTVTSFKVRITENNNKTFPLIEFKNISTLSWTYPWRTASKSGAWTAARDHLKLKRYKKPRAHSFHCTQTHVGTMTAIRQVLGPDDEQRFHTLSDQGTCTLPCCPCQLSPSACPDSWAALGSHHF